jgi:hypothetical protein
MLGGKSTTLEIVVKPQAVHQRKRIDGMKKNRVLVTILLIICGFVAYRLLREVPVGHEGARDLPRIENREREEKKTPAAEAGKWVLDNYLAGPWLADTVERQSLPVALDLQGLYEQLLRSLLPQAARVGESLLEQLERLARLRGRQSEYNKLEARLHKEKQFNRKVVLNAQLRELKNEIDQLGA